VRTRSGTVACWGDNSAHQLADGTRTPSDRPKLIYGLVGAQQLAVSSRGACALVDRGEVRCWGGNLHGELGDGTTVEHDVPMPIKAAPR
jgi:alpha-tubulin suppressor-like RCC1 family protein